jgi:heavy metal sensor kinase
MTIRLRLTIYWAGLLSLLLLSAGIAVFLLFQRQQWGRLESALMEEADTAAETISRLSHTAAIQMLQRLSEERDLGPSRRVLLVSAGRTLADIGDPDADLPVLAGTSRSTVLDGRAYTFRYAIVAFKLDGRDAYLADGVDARAVREAIKHLRTILLLVLPFLLTVSVSVGYWLAGRALSPLVAIGSALAEIKPQDLARRLASSPIQDEVARLVNAINSLLERIERASATERRFAADAAHELRTPLAVLRSGIEVALRRERHASEYVAALNSALREVIALCRMADDLLVLTRLDQEISAARQEVDLSALSREVIGAIEPLAATKHLSLNTALADKAQVEGNPEHLRRVIINLLDNALKFAPDNGHITVAVQHSDGRVVLRVADSGPGISPTELPFVFDRFFRGRAHAESGNGLGLSLCREIVQHHGGEITATNQPGGGAEFAVLLPAVTYRVPYPAECGKSSPG